jgi:hypothetical protein
MSEDDDEVNTNSYSSNPIFPTETTTRSGRVVRPRKVFGNLAYTQDNEAMGFIVRSDMSIKEALNGSRPEEAKAAILSENSKYARLFCRPLY